MIVVLPDGKLINLNLVCFTDTRSFKEPVRFSMVNGESVLCEMTEDQYQSMLLSLVHNEPLHKVLPIKEKVQKTKIDFRDFPSVLEGGKLSRLIFQFQGSFGCLSYFCQLINTLFFQ